MGILRGFATFSAASGLNLNKFKYNIYFNGVPSSVVNEILQVYGFQTGTLTFKYLGVPISAKKLSKTEGMKLTGRIVARIRGNFLWSGKSDYQKPPSVSWDMCCLPKHEGGLGIKEAKSWNKALLGKYAWWLANKQDHLWLNVPKWAFIFWAVMHRRLLTKDRLIRMGITSDSLCEICLVQHEDHIHLFGGCDYFKNCCRILQQSLKISTFPQDMVHWFSSARKTKLQRRFIGACFVGLVYAIWRVRNEARIDHYVRRPSMVIKAILAEVFARFNRRNITRLKQQDIDWI
ncbi:uncharacterized protein LOC141631540 [Silene latifolia]|uniref:uncharacterized protein LOC141631540 n=1 Tax=Silene latifolia TaxID=37657 RepID=UPI003D779E4C